MKTKTGKWNVCLFMGLSWWLVFAILLFPGQLTNPAYVHILLLMVPLVWMPLLSLKAGSFQEEFPPLNRIWIGSGILLGFAFYLEPGVFAFLLSLPWLGLSSYWAWKRRIFSFREPVTSWVGKLSFIFLAIGAAWASASRLGLEPLGFSPIIVVLTAVHFHYAGFLWHRLLTRLLRTFPNRVLRQVTQLNPLGMVLLALAISVSQLDAPIWVESVFACLMALVTALGAVFYIKAGFQTWRAQKQVALIWGLGGLSLLLAMGLAILFAWRPLLPGLGIPEMYAIHGSLNTFGMSLFLILGWLWYKNKEAAN